MTMRMIINININIYDATSLHRNHNLACQRPRRDPDRTRRNSNWFSTDDLWIPPNGVHIPQKEPQWLTP